MSETRPTDRRWTLRARLTALIVAPMLVGAAAGMLLDYSRERAVHVSETLDALLDEAEALRLARELVPDNATFAAYADRLCAEVKAPGSPGHHILVLDANGKLLVNAEHHSGPEVTQELLATQDVSSIVQAGDRRIAQARTSDRSGTTYVVAQYMDPVEALLRSELMSRIVTASLVAVTLIFLIYLMVDRWVLRPIGALSHAAEAWSRRNFHVRAVPAGPPDVEALAVRFNMLAAEQQRVEEQRRAELDQARRIQQNLMPAVIPPIPGLSIAGLFRPAESVAGDLYDVLPLSDGRTAVFILDVSGHGISAALLTGVVKMSLHRRIVEFADPADAVRATNDDLLKCTAPGSFVTACVGTWNPADHTWTWCAAGHPGGVTTRGAQAQVLPATGALLGVLTNGEWKSRRVTLEPGDRVYLFTDGITDAGRPEKVLGIEGVLKILREAPAQSLDKTMRTVANDALLLCGESTCDDITMVGFEVLAGGRGGQYYVI